MFPFEIHASAGRARAGTFHTPRGVVETPVFMPVGTLATVKALPRARLRRVVLAGRPSPALDAAAQELSSAGISGVVTQAFDATDTASHADVINGVFDGGDVDIVLLAFGLLGTAFVLGDELLERGPPLPFRVEPCVEPADGATCALFGRLCHLAQELRSGRLHLSGAESIT